MTRPLHPSTKRRDGEGRVTVTAATYGCRLPGSLLRRTYQGRSILVRVLEDAYEHEGRRFRSLSAIAQAVTGAHWNGRLFFGLCSVARREIGGGR